MRDPKLEGNPYGGGMRLQGVKGQMILARFPSDVPVPSSKTPDAVGTSTRCARVMLDSGSRCPSVLYSPTRRTRFQRAAAGAEFRFTTRAWGTATPGIHGYFFAGTLAQSDTKQSRIAG